MEKKKFEWKRPELSLKEVTEQYDCTVEDIFHRAAIGDLTIYVRADSWKVACIGSIKRFALSASADLTDNIIKDNIEAAYPEFKEIKSKDDAGEKVNAAFSRFLEEFEKLSPPNEFKEIISLGPITFYPNSGIYRASYILPLCSFQPIFVSSMSLDGMNPSEGIWLKLIDHFGITENSTDEFFVLPDHFLTLQDALKDGKLFVMKADLTRLMSIESIDPDNAKGEDDVSRKTLLQLVLGIAIDAYGYDHSASKSDAPADLAKAVKSIGFKTTNETVRKALKEAALKYPPTSTLSPLTPSSPRKPA